MGGKKTVCVKCIGLGGEKQVLRPKYENKIKHNLHLPAVGTTHIKASTMSTLSLRMFFVAEQNLTSKHTHTHTPQRCGEKCEVFQ